MGAWQSAQTASVVMYSPRFSAVETSAVGLPVAPGQDHALLDLELAAAGIHRRVTQHARGPRARDEVLAALEPRRRRLEAPVRQRPGPRADERANSDDRREPHYHQDQ